MDKALLYYKLALEGVQTFVFRQKTDAIVLNACLIQSQTDVKKALKIAFEFSPFFSETQQELGSMLDAINSVPAYVQVIITQIQINE